VQFMMMVKHTENCPCHYQKLSWPTIRRSEPYAMPVASRVKCRSFARVEVMQAANLRNLHDRTHCWRLNRSTDWRVLASDKCSWIVCSRRNRSSRRNADRPHLKR
jgi:hypothetical protein